jgi:phosphinothricin acetyltransferase
MNIRQVDLNSDIEQMTEIYNYYIENTPQTFETEPIDAEQMRKRVSETAENYPFLVAEEENQILGYAYASRFKLDQEYAYSASVAIYVRAGETSKGIGTQLYMALFEKLSSTDFHTIVAAISLPNEAGVRFHEKLGFKKVAHFYQIGYKLGRWVDVGYWQKMNIISDE